MKESTKNNTRQWLTFMRAIFGGFASLALFGSISLESYMRIPQKWLYGSDPELLPPFEHDSVVIIFPGYGGPDANTDTLRAEIKDSDKQHNADRLVMCYDWREWRGNSSFAFIRTAADSERIGKIIGTQLALAGWKPKDASLDETEPLLPSEIQVKDIHVIGISAGAFAANSCIQQYKEVIQQLHGEATLARVHARLTLLDPFTLRGLFGHGFGAKNFGVDADYFEHFVNTDDPVPFTNDALPNAYNYDVTASKQRESFTPLPNDNMHSWPAAYYGRNWRCCIDPRRKNTLFASSHDDNPRGSIHFVE